MGKAVSLAILAAALALIAPLSAHAAGLGRLNVLSPGAAQLAVGAVFLALLAVQWRGPGFLPGTDAIAYITGGVNLFTTGSFTNPGGEPELWFPPLYPILIGAASLGGRVDPATVAHLISASFALLVQE